MCIRTLIGKISRPTIYYCGVNIVSIRSSFNYCRLRYRLTWFEAIDSHGFNKIFVVSVGTSYFQRTPSGNTYKYLWTAPRLDYLTFDLQACKSARLALAENPADTSSGTYEIIIGSSANTE